MGKTEAPCSNDGHGATDTGGNREQVKDATSFFCMLNSAMTDFSATYTRAA